MTTSGSTNWTLNRDQIITAALRNIGAIATGETPSPAEINEASEALNMMIKVWQTEGAKLWLNDTKELTLTANSQSYTIGPTGVLATVRPLEIIEARYHYYTAAIDVPMTPMSRDEYFSMPLKSASGVPLQYYYDPQLTLGVFYIWPIITATTSDTIRMTVKTEVEDFDTAANTADFPTEWLRALKFNLAVELAPEYGKEVGPTLATLAGTSKMSVLDWDREKNVSVYFGVSRR